MTDLPPEGLPVPTPPASVLVPLDGSPYADRAVPVGRALAAALGGELRLLAVAHGEEAISLGEHLVAVAGQGRPEASAQVREGSPAAEIAAAAAEGPSVVCLASHGRGRLASALLGSVATEVVARSEQPVVVVGPEVAEVPIGAPGRILAGVDGSPGSEQVLAVAVAWAAALGLPLTVTTVAEPVPAVSDDPNRFSRRFGPDTDAGVYVTALAERLAGEVPVDAVALYDPISVSDGLVDHLRARPATLVAVTTHARTGVSRAVLGSTAGKIVSSCPAPVLLVRWREG